MNQNKLFNLTRWRLAAWYAGVMGVILSLSGVSIYEVMDQVHWHVLHQELQLVAGTLHDGLEPKLMQPGKVETTIEQSLPGLCIVGRTCPETSETTNRHLLGVVQQAGYYVRLLDLSEQVVATLGYQPENLLIEPQTLWQTLEDSVGNRYHQISLPLKNKRGQLWGYLQVGRSLKDFDGHLVSLRWIMLVGLPLALLLITAASWWLSGLAMRPVYQSYRHIQQFTADAAHELRTPLAAIRATLESVLGMPSISETESRSTLQTLERQNYRLSQLVQDLLLLSRMNVQQNFIETQPCCLNDIVSDIVEELSALAIAADVLLLLEIRVNGALYIWGDEEKLYRLLVNLVTNAIQYTPEGGKVTVILNANAGHAVIHIQDTGIGIALKDQMHIFDRFYRVNRDRSRATGGAGLGLSIAQAIAQAHQGSIQVQSQVNQGSTFTVRLPLMRTGLPQNSQR
jgi:signal transduction histidine kinase